MKFAKSSTVAILMLFVIAFFLIPKIDLDAADNSGSTDAKSRPNVLVILVDDMGYSDPSFMGGEAPTPNIDRLAAGGIRFTQCYNSARCCPSRAMLATGLYAHQTGIGSFATRKPHPKRGPAYLGRLNDQCVTFAEVLKSSGYQTYMVGKWHMEAPGPVARGFDEFYGYVDGYEQDQWQPERYQRLPEGRTPELKFDSGKFYATDAFTDYSLEFLKQARGKEGKEDKPWLLYLAHSSPHFPVQAPQETVDKFVETYRKGWDVLRKERFEKMQANGLANDAWTLTDRSTVPVDRDDITNGYSGQQNPAWDALPQDRREDLARRGALSAAMMHHVDQGIGKIIADLESHGELENTLILFTSDNGACYEWGPFGFDGQSRKGLTKLHVGDELPSMGGPGTYHSYGSGWANLGNTPFKLYKHFCHEGGNCSPLVAHWPAGIKQNNRWVREPIALIDVMPTLCDVAEAEYPERHNGKLITPVEGVSLTSIFAGAETLAPRTIFAEHNAARSARNGKWKAVWSKNMPNEIKWELYDIEADRCETNNLAGKYPEVVEKLSRQWMDWAAKVKVYPFFEKSDEPSEKSGSTDKAKPGEGESKTEGESKLSGVANPQPNIENVELEIKARFEMPTDNSSGVIVCQGGNQHGYSIYLNQGALVFSVRRSGKLTSTKPVPLKKMTANVSASLAKDGTMTLSVDGETIADAKSEGLITVQPMDRMTIGFDERSSAGDYSGANRFAGGVSEVLVNGVSVSWGQLSGNATGNSKRTLAPKKGKPKKREMSGKTSRLQHDSTNEPSNDVPNFVFILTDDQGWTGTSVTMDKRHPEYASDYHQTRNLERLVKEGMRFSRGYSPAPNCSPSRYANLTGKTCARLHFTDIVGRAGKLPPLGKYELRPVAKRTSEIRKKDLTIAELLKSLPNANFATAHFGKWHLRGGGPEKHGFDVSDGATGNGEGSQGTKTGEDPKRAFSITQRACDFISESQSAGRPFYCQISHYAVHAAIQHRAETLAQTKSRKPGKHHTDPAYAAMVEDLDVAVGQVLDHLDQLGLSENTFVIYQADNGCPQFLSGSAPLRGFKPETWDGGVRVPTIIRGPGVQADSQCDAVMMGIDILPTIWELAGGAASQLPESMDGGSLVPAFKAISSGKSISEIDRPGEVVIHSPHYVLTKDLTKNQRPSTAIHVGKWKLEAWYESGTVELFDLESDISESTNLASQHPQAFSKLRLRLRDYLKHVNAQMPTLDSKSFGHKGPNSTEGDVDGDGLPDEWELRELLTWAMDGNADPDADGVSNRAEFENSTDPLVGT